MRIQQAQAVLDTPAPANIHHPDLSHIRLAKAFLLQIGIQKTALYISLLF